MTYIDSRIDGEAYKHLAVRSKIGARKPFATAKKMFEVLQKATLISELKYKLTLLLFQAMAGGVS